MKQFVSEFSEHIEWDIAPVSGDLILVYFTKSKEFFLRVLSRRFIGGTLHIELGLPQGFTIKMLEDLMSRPELE
jgi:hypothetical protein